VNLQETLAVPRLTLAENMVLNQLLQELRDHQATNLRRTRYFDYEQTTRHLGIAVPRHLEKVETVLGWPAKAVESLEHRINMTGLSTPAGGLEVEAMDQIWAWNNMEAEITEAHISTLKYGCAFVAVMEGGPGEPPVVIRTLSATSSTVLWDANRRRAEAALTVTEVELGEIRGFILFLEDKVVTARKRSGIWRVELADHRLGRCPVAVLRFRPSTERSLGRSRITKPIMALTDRAVRTLLRMEIASEFYSAPRAALLGADSDLFGDDKPGWVAAISDFIEIPRSEDPEAPLPVLTQLQQASMQPLAEELRTVAGMFSGEAAIPVGQLGVIHDNPSSDAAMHTALLELNKTAERAHYTLGPGWADAFRMAVQVRDKLTAPPESLERLRARFRRPEEVTLGMAADATMKLVSTGILSPTSEIAMEMLDWDELTIQRRKTEIQREAGGSILASLPTAEPGAEGADLKAKFDALGVAIRSGVDPEAAAAMLGLSGVKFTGAMPTSLRLPEEQAEGLEDGGAA